MTHTTLIAALFAALVLILGPTLDERASAQATADTLHDAQQHAQAQAALQAQYLAGVHRVCGPQATGMHMQGARLQCQGPQGHITHGITISEATP